MKCGLPQSEVTQNCEMRWEAEGCNAKATAVIAAPAMASADRDCGRSGPDARCRRRRWRRGRITGSFVGVSGPANRQARMWWGALSSSCMCSQAFKVSFDKRLASEESKTSVERLELQVNGTQNHCSRLPAPDFTHPYAPRVLASSSAPEPE